MGQLDGHRIAVLLESDFYEPEILYYERRFAEEGAETHFLTRLWGQETITFHGHEFRMPYECGKSFEDMADDQLLGYSAVIVPSGMVADRLRYTEDIHRPPPATEFLRRAFAQPTILKGLICHAAWLLAPAPELLRDRRIVVHNNLLGDARNMGARYVDADVVVDGDLVTARTGAHCHLFARQLIDLLHDRQPASQGAS